MNKWIPVPQPTRERRRYLMKQHTTMGPDTILVSCGPRRKLFTKQLLFCSRSTEIARALSSKGHRFKRQLRENNSDDFSKGFIVRLEKADCFKVNQRRECYLPHRPVVPPHKPGKVRRVLNGAEKIHGQTLNGAFLAGSYLLQSLFHILFRFRQYPLAVYADIEGMFLQVGVIPRD